MTVDWAPFRWPAQISTADQPAAPSEQMVSQKNAVEVQLPQIPQYVALELEV